MLALAFGIVNTMLMAILEHTPEIGVLKALGMNKRRLFSMILTETLFLVGVGVPFGLVLGWGVTTFFGIKGIDMTAFGEAVLEDFGYAKLIYPYFPMDMYPQMILLVIVTAFLSALYPAYKALRLRPVEAIRK
jgi:putative ABC transport system permease protein